MSDDDYSLSTYHERSKHRLNRYAPGPGRLDWANQPNPFRRYEGAKQLALPLRADGLETRFSDLRRGLLPPARDFDLDSIATLLEMALGISAWKAYGETRWALRCNPSSGNLHPTEGYLVTAGVPGIEAGVHHYVSCDHELELRGHWDAPIEIPGILVGLSSITWREAWKYGMRAFRYCQHDCGHAIAAVAYAAAALGWKARLLAGPSDVQIAALLGLEDDLGGAERESPECLIWITRRHPGVGRDPFNGPYDWPLVPPPRTPDHWHGTPNRLSSQHVHWADIDHAHRLTLKSEPSAEPPPRYFAADAIASKTVLDLSAAEVTRQRRSAVDFDGVTTVSSDAFFAMLDATLPRLDTPPWSAWPWAAEVHPAIMVHRVEGLDPGLYILVRDPVPVEPLKASMRADWLWKKVGPPELPLYLLVPFDLRDTARMICCHQDIAADSCYALGMISRFEVAQAEPWRYRTLYWECGMLGHVLYLEAEAAGIRATGIGCFFDDEMHDLLGLTGTRWQSLYHFTAGGPVDDRRLTTLRPYLDRASAD